ncbi:hypothetical protein DIE06_08135 [Burkholderia sp. Bp8998]|nr:hypothetical protein DIE06_08135 [Burkholderia sp. Bp8998]
MLARLGAWQCWMRRRRSMTDPEQTGRLLNVHYGHPGDAIESLRGSPPFSSRRPTRARTGLTVEQVQQQRAS